MALDDVRRTAGPYETTGGETLLPYDFRLLDAADITVWRRRGGGTVELGLGVDYTLTGVGLSAGGNVVLVAAALVGDIYMLEGSRAHVRTSDLNYARALPPATVNAELDSLQAQIAELRDSQARSLSRSRFDDPDGAALELPPIEPNKALGTDADGNLTFIEPGSGGGSGSIPDPLPLDRGGTGANDAEAARTNLGLGALATKNAVNGADITDLSVGTADIIDKAVTPAKVSDGLRPTVVESWAVNTPPGSPVAGKVWIVGPSPTGAWVGHAKHEARWISSAWSFRVPVSGDTAHALGEQQTIAYDGTQWVVTGVGEIGQVTGRLATSLNAGRYGGGLTRSAILDGLSVVVWGDGAGGKNCQSGARDVASPEIIPFESTITAIKKLVSGDGRHYVIDQDDFVWSAGDGVGYALGHENENDCPTFKRIAWLYSRNIKVRDIVVGRPNGTDQPFVLFVTTADTVYSAGHGLQGQRGDGTTTTNSAPTQVTTQDAGTPPLSNVKQVSVGGYPHTCAAVTKAGLLYTWGFNGHGQLGDGTTTNGVRGVKHPTITTASSVLACSSGAGGNVYVIKSDGSLLGAGTNSRGELAQGASDLANKSTFVAISYAETFASLHGGDGPGGTRCAVTTLGKLVMWGPNTYGWHGFGDTSDRYGVSLPSGSFQGSVAEVAVAGAGTEAVFVRTSDRVFAAGYNANLNTATGFESTPISTFAELRGLPGGTIAELRAMGGAAAFGPMVLYADGRIWTGGAGAQGELGWQIGAQANALTMQDVLIKGQRGQGTSGPGGPPGLNPGILYEVQASTVMADPGARGIRFNNPDPFVATQMAVSIYAAMTGNPNFGNWIKVYGANTSMPSNRGQALIKALDRDGVMVGVVINGAIVDNGTWLQIPIAGQSPGSGVVSWVTSERLVLELVRTGNAGSMTGPGSSVDGTLAGFSGTGGNVLQALTSAAAADNQIAVGDPLGAKPLRWVNATELPLSRFGGFVNSATDSGSALQSAVDSDVPVILFEGSYRVDTTVNITRAVTLRGQGKTYPGGTSARTPIITQDASADVLRVNANSVRLIGIDLRGTGARSTVVKATAKEARGIVIGTIARTLTDAAMTSGSATVSSLTAAFVAGDVGKRCHVTGAYTGTSTPTITAVAGDGLSATLSMAANVTVSGATMMIAPVFRDFAMEDCSIHSQSIGLDCRNASNLMVRFNQIHGALAFRHACEVAPDIGDSKFFGNEYNTIGGSGTRCVLHTSGGSPIHLGDKMQTAEIQYECDWSVGTSGGPQLMSGIWENAGSKHFLFKDDGTGANILENTIISGNIFNGAPTTQGEFSDAGGTGWMKGVEIVANRFTSGGAGTMLSLGKAVSGANIAANTFYDSATGSGSTGIDIKASSAKVTVGVNHFDGVSTPLNNASGTASFEAHAQATVTGNGFFVRTATNARAMRAIGGTANEVSVTNGDGVSGNPTVALPGTLELGTKTVNVGDSLFSIKDTADTTKVAKFETGSITTATTRTLTVPDASGTIQLQGVTHVIPAGSLGAPGLGVSGDANTGIWSPGADTLAISTGGAERMRFDSSGQVGIGTSPSSPLHVYLAGGGTIARLQSGTGEVYFNLQNTAGSTLVGASSSTAFFQVPSGGRFEAQQAGGTKCDVLADTFKATSYTVATLPSAGTKGAGSISYASNGRKNGEGAGVGTGVLVFSDSSAWRACDTGATVAA